MSDTPGSHGVDAELALDLLNNLKTSASKMMLQTVLSAASRLQTLMPVLKKPLVILRNTLDGVSSALEDGSIKQAAAKRMTAEAVAAFEDQVKLQLSMLSRQSDQELKRELVVDSLNEYSVDLDSIKRKLINQPYFVGYTSVLPVVTPFLSMQALTDSGFQAELYHGYTILKKQFVAGLSTDYIRKRLESESDRKLTADDVYNEFIDLIKAKHRGLNLVSLGNTVSVENCAFTWLMPDRQLRVLRTCTSAGRGSKNLNIKSWGFPFTRT